MLVLGLLAAVACDYGSDEGALTAGRGPAAGFDDGTVLIDTGGDSVLVDVEVADTPAERGRGLMFRRSLPPNAGMVFIYFEPHDGGFWMKNTYVPLSIAFFDRDGEILRILDMRPCRRDPCRIYDPGVAYWGALEVDRGAFDRWGVEVGDTLRLTQ